MRRVEAENFSADGGETRRGFPGLVNRGALGPIDEVVEGTLDETGVQNGADGGVLAWDVDTWKRASRFWSRLEQADVEDRVDFHCGG
jgi:hypothetical protein